VSDRGISQSWTMPPARVAPPSVFQTDQLDEARSYMTRVFRPHDLSLVRGAAGLSMRHEQLSLGATSIHWLEYGSTVQMTSPEMGGFYLFQLNLQGDCTVRQGSAEATVATGHAYAVNPTRPLTKSWSADCRQLIVRVDRPALDRLLQRELGVDLTKPLEFSFQPVPLSGAAAALIRTVVAFRSADTEVGWVPHSRIVRHAEAMLMSMLLSGFQHSYTDDFGRAAAACAPAYVRRVEDFIHASAREVTGMEEMVAVAGVSSRALYNGFRQFRNTTPMAYLKAVRLDMAHAELLRPQSGESVTAIALNCGFSHMSKFARDFRARFGYRPSEILRRRS
jgi:AraC-like DNA-binding protein